MQNRLITHRIHLKEADFGKDKIYKILLKIAPPVMLAQLIQSLYNIVDSFFVGKYSDDALTALTVIYPIQLIIIALAVGTGVGVNTFIASKYAQNQEKEADKAAGTGTILAVLTWIVIAVSSIFLMKPYVLTSTKTPAAVEAAVTYGIIVCVGSVFTILEGTWTKIHQARGKMLRPMIAQIVGALVNIALDPLLIFGKWFFPELGVAGAAYATVAGQCATALIVAFGAIKKPPKIKEMWYFVKKIYFYGFSSILMQSLYTVYILALNIILSKFSDEAVVVLGLYYKLQSFFFIPLFGLQTCIVPVLSYNYTQKNYARCKGIMNETYLISAVFMIVGTVCFVFFPEKLIALFSKNTEVLRIGGHAFPIIGACFIPAVFSLIMPTFFQAIGKGLKSAFLSVLRQLICLVPIFYALSFLGQDYVWLSFPISETISGAVGLIMYFCQLKTWKKETLPAP